ncbi:MAG TPA: penicillin-binding protein 2 [Candidatus Polarisedimenticolaceae bacterium]|nr:penicillin-binding protein 2 [Candidatus Polarisedimenticolaceae bacterium]
MPTTTRNRLILVSSMVVLVALAIVGRLYQLQVIRCEGLSRRAAEQHSSKLVVPAMRGTIVDRNGKPLALSTETRSLYAHPQRVGDPERAAELLGPLLDRPRAAILRDLRSDKSFVFLARFLEPDVADRIAALGLPMNGAEPFGFEHEPRRVYPRKELAVHVVGFATIDGDGVEGIERSFDADLKGDPRIYLLMHDAHRRGPRELIGEPRKKPSDVVLTIDVVLQHVVERELARAMRETRARAGSVILLDAPSGEVLALANRPTTDANEFGQATHAARRNRALVDQYEPGSTFKVVPLAAAIELNRVGARDRIYCEQGVYRRRGRTIRDLSRNGTLTPAEILSKSSNIGMAKIAKKMTPEEMSRVINRFGFGAKTGVELPGEEQGLFEDPSRWSGYSQESISFGQEIGVTAMQMAAAISVFANDGVMVPPRIVLGKRGPDGRLRPMPPTATRRVVSERTASTVARMLEGVVDHGTGRRAAVAGYRVAGKSGTAQRAVDGVYSTSAVTASFGGFAPADDPRLVLLVVLDTPRIEDNGGGQAAAPVFARIMAESLSYLRVPGDDPERQATLSLEHDQPALPARHAAAAAMGKDAG